MTPKEFFLAVLPSAGVYFVALPVEGKPYFKHLDAQSPKELYGSVVGQLSGNYGTGLYFAVNSFKRASRPHPLKPGKFQTGRQADEMVASRTLYADIDCKGEKDQYKSKQEALAAISVAVKAGSLPKPSIVVDSGNGIHLYWIADEEIDYTRWKPIAEGLKHHMLGLGLKIDKTVTADAARILRVPGSFNRKSEPPIPCKILHASGAVYGWEEFPQSRAATVSANGSVMGSSARNPVPAERLARACQVVRAELKSGGAGTQEPLWNEMALLTTRVDKGAQLFHLMSRKHASYHPAATQTKFDTAAGKPQNIFSTCRSISGAGGNCTGCPFQGKIKTPIDLARDLMNDPPYPYSIQPGGVFRDSVDKDTGAPMMVKLTGVQLSNLVWYREPDTNTEMLRFQVNDGGTKFSADIKLPMILGDNNATNRYLGERGITAQPDRAKELGNMIHSWHEQLKLVQPAHEASAQIGWTPDGKDFHLPTTTYTKSGPKAAVTPVLDKRYDNFEPEGTIEGWRVAADITAKSAPALQIMLAMAFGAPLMRLINEPGFVFVFRSDRTGTGKTTTLKVASAVWHNPKMFFSSTDTRNSVAAMIETAPAIPQWWDEVKFKEHRTDREEWTQFLHQFVNGRQKRRMRADQTVTQPVPTHTMLGITTNEDFMSLLEANSASPEAMAARICQVDVPPLDASAVDEQRVLAGINSNYGHAGPIFIAAVQKNRTSVENALERTALSFSKNELNGIPFARKRFYATAAACLLVGAELANRLGLIEMDVPALRTHLAMVMRGHVDQSQEYVEAFTSTHNWAQAIKQGLLENRDRWLVTVSPYWATSMTYYEPTRNHPLVHIDTVNKEVICTRQALDEILQSQRVNYNTLARSMPTLNKRTLRLFFGRGTIYSARKKLKKFTFQDLDISDNVAAFLKEPPIESGGSHRQVG